MKFDIKRLFDLFSSQGDTEAIDASIRKGAVFGGANLWVLFFAILIASVGLNVNSTAVIIGAMLISPLMGPILAIGYGAGVGDIYLIKRSAKSLSLFVLISLVTASLYFSLSPLDKVQSEILARTSPTVWDILIAFFGGCAGIVAVTRKEVSTVVPGVAIATALMPPLCTAGFGIANGNFQFFIGAFYLFTINSVFIAFSTLIFVKILRLPMHVHSDQKNQRKTRLWVAAAVVATVLPSSYFTLQLLRNEVFENSVASVLKQSEQSAKLLILSRKVDAKARRVELTLGGERNKKDVAQDITRLLTAAGVKDAHVEVRYSGSDRIDISALKQELQQDIYQTTLQQLAAETARAETLRKQVAQYQLNTKRQADVIAEMMILFPEITSATVARGVTKASAESQSTNEILSVNLAVKEKLSVDTDRLTHWIQEKFPSMQVQTTINVSVADEAAESKPTLPKAK